MKNSRLLCAVLLALCASLNSYGQIELTPTRLNKGQPAPFMGRLFSEDQYQFLRENLDSNAAYTAYLDSSRWQAMRAADLYRESLTIREAQLSDAIRQKEESDALALRLQDDLAKARHRERVAWAVVKYGSVALGGAWAVLWFRR